MSMREVRWYLSSLPALYFSAAFPQCSDHVRRPGLRIRMVVNAVGARLAHAIEAAYDLALDGPDRLGRKLVVAEE